MRSLSLLLAAAFALGACASGAPANEGLCGDGIVQAQRGEQCDDGNNIGGDGCSAGCISEAGAEIDCNNGIDDDNDGLTDCADP
ncbi:MAG: DUF4215 domain-containing protein, partial [Polyangia bacterium]|nr:DUF4215 domain-containing protein [Polyangia bacterium]